MEDIRRAAPRQTHRLRFAGVDLTFFSPFAGEEYSDYLDAMLALAEQDVPHRWFPTLNGLIVSALDKDSRKRWEKRLKEKDDPLTIADLVQLTDAMVEVAAGRPAVPLSPSGDTDESGSTSSTDDSSSQEDEEPQPLHSVSS